MILWSTHPSVNATDQIIYVDDHYKKTAGASEPVIIKCPQLPLWGHSTSGTYPVIDGHEEDKPGLGEDVEDGEEQPGQQELGDFASQAGLEDC